MNPLESHLQKTGHPLRIWSGDHVAVYAANGYLIVRDRRGGRDLYLSRKQLVALLPKAVKAVRLMSRSVDVERRMKRQADLENEVLAGLRSEKRARKSFDTDAVSQAQRQRARYLKAKERARNRADD